MKRFKQLSPRQIARHIKSFHQGYFAIESLGIFEFHAGKISLHGLSCRQRLQLARQLNRAVSQLGHHTSLPDS